MIIHISQERFQRILSQGYNLSDEGALFQMPQVVLSADTRVRFASLNQYHLLDAEAGHCTECVSEFNSILVNSPIELEAYKANASDALSEGVNQTHR